MKNKNLKIYRLSNAYIHVERLTHPGKKLLTEILHFNEYSFMKTTTKEMNCLICKRKAKNIILWLYQALTSEWLKHENSDNSAPDFFNNQNCLSMRSLTKR